MKRAITLKPPRKISAKNIDRNNPPWLENMLGSPRYRRGRGPQRTPTKVSTTIRLDRDVLEFFRALGAGYQSRINDTLRKAIRRKLTSDAGGRRLR
jgi:uncharacterized protein (DUF4415 family)